MRLASLQLCNFRQFYGTTPELSFLGGGKKKITVIHGNNGAGKTTLLNACTWALYGKFTDAFRAPEQLVNKRALAEVGKGEPVDCWVELTFEHDSRTYQVSRSIRAKNKEDGIWHSDDELKLLVAHTDGRWVKPDQEPEQIINKVLPESLHRYFFFDGERIERIVQTDKRKEIAEATKTLIGLEVIDRSVRHLKEVRTILRDKLKTVGSAKTQELVERQEALESHIKQVGGRQQEIETELKNHGQRKDEISQRLRELAEVRQLQLRRDELEKQEKLQQEQRRQAKANLKLAISTRGYTVLLKEATAKFRGLVDGLRERGELPADIKQQFVRDLLTRGSCICGSELREGTDEYQQVEAFLSRAGLADVEETVIRMGAQVDGIEAQVPKFWEEVEREQGRIQQLTKSISQIEDSLDNIRDQISRNPSENIQNLEAQLAKTEQTMSSLTLEKGKNEQQIKQSETEIGKLKQEIEKLEKVERKQKVAQARLSAADEVITRFEQLRKNYGLRFRADLEQRIQEVFSQISFTAYTPRLTEKYELMLEEDSLGRATAVAASQGESQILSLSFIGAIVDKVRDWSKKQSNSLFAGINSEFPIVMDSPFGALDAVHRRQVAKSIPILANQLVVLVSKTQWRDEVAEEMDLMVGKMYVLAYHSPKQDCEVDSIRLRSGSYELVRASVDGYEWTEVVEVM